MKYNKKTRTRTRRKKGGNGSRSDRRKRRTKKELLQNVANEHDRLEGNDTELLQSIISYEFDRIEEMLDTLTSIVKRIESRMNRQSTARDGSIVTSHRVSPHVIPPDEG